MESLLRNMIGEENFQNIFRQFEEIRQHGININAGINTIIQNQKMMELNAMQRHAQLMECFEQQGVRPIPDAAAIPESPVHLNGKGNEDAEFQPGENRSPPTEN